MSDQSKKTTPLSPRLRLRLEQIDWDFTGSFSDSTFSRVHWHPGRFVSQIPATLIGLLSRPGDTVLDPFCGSGTVLVEAQRLGRRSIGFDLNPVSCLLSQAKTLAVSARRLIPELEVLLADAATQLNTIHLRAKPLALTHEVPESVQLEKWYNVEVRSQLVQLWRLVARYRGVRRIVARACFSALLLPVCREERHWGYVCDNSMPKSNRGGNVLHEYARFLQLFRDAYLQRDIDLAQRFDTVGRLKTAEVRCGNSIALLPHLRPKSVHLVVTSPPYFGVCDYTKAQRLSMEWLGHDIEPLRLNEIGARSKRHRRTAVHEYLKQLQDVFAKTFVTLRPSSFAAVVFGQSETRQQTVPAFRRAVESVGFELALDLNRTVTAQRRQAPSIHEEHLMIFHRP